MKKHLECRLSIKVKNEISQLAQGILGCLNPRLSQPGLSNAIFLEERRLQRIKQAAPVYSESRYVYFHEISSHFIDILSKIMLTRWRCGYSRTTVLAGFSLLAEAAFFPSPGLVNLIDSGPHRDMDFFTFVRSVASLLPFFEQALSDDVLSEGDEEVFQKLREIGYRAETSMFSFTNHINTHKGSIFLFLIVIGAYRLICHHKIQKKPEELFATIRKMTGKVLDQDIRNNKNETIGQRANRDFGLLGIRGEVIQGLPNVRHVGLTVFQKTLSEGRRLNRALTTTLLHIQSELNDTTLLSRGYTLKRIDRVKQLSSDLKHLSLTKTKAKYFITVDKIFVMENLNPGGAADLTAVTLFVWLLFNIQGLAIGGKHERIFV
ncbi:2-(5''-triphosphoribosyl)-3'-dephosphocoenzyme-A synthase [compost metagenome]